MSPPPGAAVQEGVWLLVCLAAVAAMEHGRARLWALRRAAMHAPAAAPGGGGDGVPALPVAVVEGVSRQAAARFWHILHDFVMAGQPAVSQWDLPPGHPFLSSGASGLRVVLPLPGLGNGGDTVAVAPA